MDVKKCSRCKIVKPLEEFHRDKNLRDGRNYYCKECIKLYHVKIEPGSVNVKNYFEKVKENKERLNNCEGPHDLQLMPPPDGKEIFRKFMCTKCGGIIEGPHAEHYEQGLRHGRKEKALND